MTRTRFALPAFAAAVALVASLALAAALPSFAFAAVSTVETAEVTPSYPNPVTGEIEDPGDPNMVAMAESMMEGVTFPYALVETDTDGTCYVTLRFNLADQESGVWMEASTDGGATYADVPAGEVTAENAEENTADWRFTVPAGTTHLRSHLGVIPIEREVIYFLTLGNAVEGNAAGFVQTVTPGEGAEEPEAAEGAEPATTAEAEPTDGSAAAGEDAEEAAPEADAEAAAGIKEYNAEGRDVTGGVSEEPELDGGTIALVAAVAVVVVAVAGIVVFVAYVRPKRARQAAAAAAAQGQGATPNSAGAAETKADDTEASPRG